MERVGLVCTVIWLAATCSNEPGSDRPVGLKIGRPTQGGLYIGQYEWNDGDIATFEAAIGRRTALWSVDQPMTNAEGEAPVFDPHVAESAWQQGRVVFAHAYEATPRFGFTVDRLLQGAFDAELERLAEQFRAFGKPMFFNTAREPNCVLSEYAGGFGPSGEDSFTWAAENERGTAEFDPSGYPHPELYEGLGDPEACDGIERLIAAQRYYHRFFAQQRGLDFLTFDTMGWAASPTVWVSLSTPGTYRYQLGVKCADFRRFYPGDKYVDWVSVNWYLGYEAPPETSTVQERVDEFQRLMSEVRSIAPTKPVFVMELGFADIDPVVAGEKVDVGLTTILSQYSEIGGFAVWSSTPDILNDFLIRPGSPQAEAFRKVIARDPSKFHSCVQLSDGSLIPNCDDDAIAGGTPCTVGVEHGVTCPSLTQCSSKEWIDGCCINGSC